MGEGMAQSGLPFLVLAILIKYEICNVRDTVSAFIRLRRMFLSTESSKNELD